MKVLVKEELLYLERQIRMELVEISHGFLDQGWNFRHLRAAFTRIYFPLEGKGFLTFGDRTVELTPGKIYVVPSGLDFSCSCPKSLNKVFVHLNLTHPDGSDAFGGIGSCLVLEDDEGLSARMMQLCDRRDLRSVLELKLLLYGVLERALAQAMPERTEIKQFGDVTRAALAYIEAHLRADLCIGEIADALFVSRAALQKAFKADLDKSIGKYIDTCLMARAEILLLERALSVKEVGERLGFCDQFYFSRKFVQAHGISPRVFRQLHSIGKDEPSPLSQKDG
ncbi:MAG: helix-turn-helix transcriptional regulator [Clostridia bacterium]|nr:helix-turn-helix transcriptional regulator [Clostridia bacterium]